MPTATSSTLSRNGTRQPHARNCASVRFVVNRLNTTVDRSRPAGTPICGQLPDEAAAAVRRVLDRHQHGAAPLAADADALREAQHDEQHRRPDADRVVGRQQPDQKRRDAHDHAAS